MPIGPNVGGDPFGRDQSTTVARGFARLYPLRRKSVPMNRPAHWLGVAIALALAVIVSRPVFGQDAASSAAPQNGPAAAVKAVPDGPHRNLAPGVMRSIDPTRRVAESFSIHDVTELLAVDPNFDFAKEILFPHDVWSLEFQFKPVRTIWVDIPQPSGKMQRELIWYMVYAVTNRAR